MIEITLVCNSVLSVHKKVAEKRKKGKEKGEKIWKSERKIKAQSHTGKVETGKAKSHRGRVETGTWTERDRGEKKRKE